MGDACAVFCFEVGLRGHGLMGAGRESGANGGRGSVIVSMVRLDCGRVQRPAPTATASASSFGDGLTGCVPSDDEIHAALSRVGMGNVLLSQGDRTVRLRQDGVSIDLGGIGKGYAVERAARKNI